ncbi:MAG: prolipoprotein diacylglyceryl transferase [Chitinivibrionales bacterium]
MHPVIFHILNFPIHSYGLMLALSFLFGIWFASWRAKKNGLESTVISDVGFYLILSSIIGARLYYVILHFEEFRGDLWGIINPFHGGNLGIGGLVMYGGFIGALLASVAYFKIKKYPFLPYADAVAPSIGFGIFLTRIGCFLNGCCFGAPTHASWGITFPAGSPAGVYQHECHAAALYPSQLIESAGGLIIAIIVLIVGRLKPAAGIQFYLVGIMYSILRFGVDFTRFYSPQERLGALSHNQVVCIVFFILFTGLTLKSLMFKEDEAMKEAPGEGTTK